MQTIHNPSCPRACPIFDMCGWNLIQSHLPGTVYGLHLGPLFLTPLYSNMLKSCFPTYQCRTKLLYLILVIIMLDLQYHKAKHVSASQYLPDMERLYDFSTTLLQKQLNRTKVMTTNKACAVWSNACGIRRLQPLNPRELLPWLWLMASFQGPRVTTPCAQTKARILDFNGQDKIPKNKNSPCQHCGARNRDVIIVVMKLYRFNKVWNNRCSLNSA